MEKKRSNFWMDEYHKFPFRMDVHCLQPFFPSISVSLAYWDWDVYVWELSLLLHNNMGLSIPAHLVFKAFHDFRKRVSVGKCILDEESQPSCFRGSRQGMQNRYTHEPTLGRRVVVESEDGLKIPVQLLWGIVQSMSPCPGLAVSILTCEVQGRGNWGRWERSTVKCRAPRMSLPQPVAQPSAGPGRVGGECSVSGWGGSLCKSEAHSIET